LKDARSADYFFLVGREQQGMSVLSGERTERRRIFHEGRPEWVRLEGDNLALGDGREVAESDATYMAPCEPTKIICIHLN
jgi:5-oxopent-3-ene-1,2,5-tricarboxylate decarboxylase/2-hydroxyhepta-2,4-diene-1,7-dioate isomerase